MEKFLNPIEVLKEINLTEEMSAADFGCGSGGWAIPLAQTVTDGRVYAIDILGEPISALKARIKIENITNIAPMLSNIERGVDLLDESLDLVLMTNFLFQVSDKKKVMDEAKRVLKTGGKVLVVDWQPNATLGPKEGRIAVEEVKKLAEASGLKLEKEFTASPYHYGLIYVK